jgi:hypothetical protein
MNKILAISLAGIAALVVALPADARPRDGRYTQYRDYPVYQNNGYVSDTDRDGDGYDDRDTNFNGWIDPWEQRSGGYRYGSNQSATDRDGDGYDDRDRNFNGYIDPWEYRRVRRR